MKKYDVIIIGAGQAGTPLAKKMARAGKKTAIVEKRLVGGTCINDGCTPTKTWVASAKAAYMMQHSGKLGVHVKDFTIDMLFIKKRKDEIVDQFRDGSQNGLEETKGVDLIFGEAYFTGEKTLTIKLKGGGTQELTADLIFINTGAKTAIPDIDGLKDIDYLTSTSILELKTVPENLTRFFRTYFKVRFFA